MEKIKNFINNNKIANRLLGATIISLVMFGLALLIVTILEFKIVFVIAFIILVALNYFIAKPTAKL